MQSFDELKLAPSLAKALKAMNFSQPTPIQAQAIPIVMQRKDLIGCAQTGTGKTAAFAIPLMTQLLTQPQMMALILVPTRELGVQIVDVLRKLSSGQPQLNPCLLIGGMSMYLQRRDLQRKPRILVATPGRLIDHLNNHNLNLKSVGILVLDEADQMLDMGFEPQLNEILRFLPRERQTLLFSATMPEPIAALAQRYLRSPQRVNIGAVSKPIEKIQQRVIQTTVDKKNDMLLDELNARQGSVIIFARTQKRTDRVYGYLTEYGYSVARIHGGRSQGQRNLALAGFRQGKFRILVATDIAARGLDIPQIGVVINYDLPQSPEDYVHRIGRTARAGAEGESLTFLIPEDRNLWWRIAKRTEGAPQVNMPRMPRSGRAPQERPQVATRTRSESRSEFRAESRPQERSFQRSDQRSERGEKRSEYQPRSEGYGPKKKFQKSNPSKQSVKFRSQYKPEEIENFDEEKPRARRPQRGAERTQDAGEFRRKTAFGEKKRKWQMGDRTPESYAERRESKDGHTTPKKKSKFFPGFHRVQKKKNKKY